VEVPKPPIVGYRARKWAERVERKLSSGTPMLRGHSCPQKKSRHVLSGAIADKHRRGKHEAVRECPKRVGVRVPADLLPTSSIARQGRLPSLSYVRVMLAPPVTVKAIGPV